MHTYIHMCLQVKLISSLDLTDTLRLAAAALDALLFYSSEMLQVCHPSKHSVELQWYHRPTACFQLWLHILGIRCHDDCLLGRV